MSTTATSDLVRAPLRARLLAIAYDALIVFLLVIVVSTIVQQILIHSGAVQLEQIPISKDEHIMAIPMGSFANKAIKSLWFFLSFFYFGYYWTKRGQTPGMKVWKIKVINPQQQSAFSWTQALLRYVAALFGLGLLLIPFNSRRLALQDMFSQSLLVSVE